MSNHDKRATEVSLDELHGKLAEHWKKRLDSGEDLSAAELTALQKFLTDNGIKCLPGSGRIAPVADAFAALDEDTDESKPADAGPMDLSQFSTRTAH